MKYLEVLEDSRSHEHPRIAVGAELRQQEAESGLLLVARLSVIQLCSLRLAQKLVSQPANKELTHTAGSPAAPGRLGWEGGAAPEAIWQGHTHLHNVIFYLISHSKCNQKPMRARSCLADWQHDISLTPNTGALHPNDARVKPSLLPHKHRSRLCVCVCV